MPLMGRPVSHKPESSRQTLRRSISRVWPTHSSCWKTKDLTCHTGIASVLPDGTVTGIADGEVPDVRKQTATVLDTIDKIVRGASGGKGGVANVVDAVVYLTEMQRDYAGMNEEWNKVFGSREVAPARATIGVKDLPDPRFVVEVKAVAVVPA